jgi:exodeoxyribonuclease V alpha subunit
MDENTLGELTGCVNSVIFQNDENGYTVLRLDADTGEQVTVVGCLPFAVPGEQLILTGSWTHHPSHGRQFKAESAQRSMPTDENAIFLFLSSGEIKGVGPATARAIVDEFGADSLRVMEQEPERLSQLKQITPKRAKDISEQLRRRGSVRRLMDFFASNGIRIEYALRLYKNFGDDAQAELMANPYIIADEYYGAPFREADMLAISLGFEATCPERLEAAALYELSYNASNGHCFIPRDKLVAASAQLIGVQNWLMDESVGRQIDSGDIICETVSGVEACYLARLHYAECFVAERIKQLADNRFIESASADKLIEEAEREMKVKLAYGQQEAVKAAATSGVLALTGGPGTGKTTTVRAILTLFDRMGLETLLAAPTGRAAKRMSELCSREAATIHRLLETGYDPDLGALVFKHNADEPLKADAVILDECSMIDIELMQALLSALPEHCRLVLVGDADQLPSVGPGNVFSDIIRSGRVNTVRLEIVFRQAAESKIVRNAHLINRGELPEIRENKGDFFMLRRKSAESAVSTILELCSERLPKNMGIDPSQIQVLAPTRLYETGTANLNRRLQDALNPKRDDKPEKQLGEQCFRLGDRVMQIRNNYDIVWRKTTGEMGAGIFNGDVGHICELDTRAQYLTVDFDDKRANYTFDMLPELELAYAMTVHKAQGSEYRAVVLSLFRGAKNLMSRSVLYTAVTRARELLIIVGDDGAIEEMVRNSLTRRRYSALRLRLSE